MVIILSFVLFLGGLYLIIKGGDFLVNAAISLNKITGINQVIIGATFISVATTLPEVFVSIFAVLSGTHGIAVGNAIGSMICNIALVLALYFAFSPQKIKRDAVISKTFYLIIVTALVILFAGNFRISLLEGMVLLCIFVAFLYYNIKEAKVRDAQDLSVLEPCLQSGAEEAECRSTVVRNIVLGFITGQIMLIIGAFLLVQHGERLALVFGISETVVGLTVIAVGTSMPELITAITSIKKKSSGLALGNILGANILNCTLLLGTCGFISDLKGAALPISRDMLFVSLPFLLIASLVATIPMLIKGKTYRWQGFMLLGLYGLYLFYLLLTQPI